MAELHHFVVYPATSVEGINCQNEVNQKGAENDARPDHGGNARPPLANHCQDKPAKRE